MLEDIDMVFTTTGMETDPYATVGDFTPSVRRCRHQITGPLPPVHRAATT